MNSKQAVKFWNHIAMGEIIGFTSDTDVCQGGVDTKPNYTSAVCDHYDLNQLQVPYERFVYGGGSEKVGPIKEHAQDVVKFLREIADSIESSIL